MLCSAGYEEGDGEVIECSCSLKTEAERFKLRFGSRAGARRPCGRAFAAQASVLGPRDPVCEKPGAEGRPGRSPSGRLFPPAFRGNGTFSRKGRRRRRYVRRWPGRRGSGRLGFLPGCGRHSWFPWLFPSFLHSKGEAGLGAEACGAVAISSGFVRKDL